MSDEEYELSVISICRSTARRDCQSIVVDGQDTHTHTFHWLTVFQRITLNGPLALWPGIQPCFCLREAKQRRTKVRLSHANAAAVSPKDLADIMWSCAPAVFGDGSPLGPLYLPTCCSETVLRHPRSDKWMSLGICPNSHRGSIADNEIRCKDTSARRGPAPVPSANLRFGLCNVKLQTGGALKLGVVYCQAGAATGTKGLKRRLVGFNDCGHRGVQRGKKGHHVA